MAAEGRKKPFWGVHTFCLITGASRGLGQGLAVTFAPCLGEGSLMLLMARSKAGMTETKEKILTIAPGVTVKMVEADLSSPDKEFYMHTISSSLAECNVAASDFEHVLIIHNAGSLGNRTTRAIDLEDVEECQKYFSLNLFSVMCLNSQIFKVFRKNAVSRKTVINISSLLALEPMRSLSCYCMGKAARDMFFKVLAQEEPSLMILNYAPGPLETDMIDELAKKNVGQPGITNMFAEMRAKGQVLTVDTTCQRLIKILGEEKYKSGDHVDYFDDI